ncbi:porin [Vibrio cincinnatiensis]|uniref:Outer membrane protein (Porin) n=1 Tax=Vibrio cincinnatiensis DSM 19608 TaxID=1123491 RepID=A0A1T4PMA5_VIBCI|nr:porin [Vibrio cincinnatiensis]MCG3722470.1 porin [Vibrio cincinnatiensis]MCG3736981.1 porin [Vibrio cincinnatiensis]MCG3758564.1 porin [Vibrio cincinnatiensis]MCG3761800.1 porin [Vibrio cincinnatiensis]SJZ92680.1 Outer membrane protein (porin) [Vibrio cincinnatiensis DSM 19608]
MDKMFKRSLLGAAVATMLSSGAAFSVSAAESANYEVYGVIALQAAYRDYDTGSKASDDNLGGTQFNNESRLGFRGEKDFKNIESTFIWQIEAGYVDPSFSDPGSEWGARDTFVGFKHDSYGTVRLGRVLSPLYELVDWPASNPGLGDVFDWGGAIGGTKHQDRASNTIRWDTPTFADSLSLNLAYGVAGKDGAQKGDGKDYWMGAAAHYKLSVFQFDLAYEGNRDVAKEETEWDNDAYLFGVQGWFDNGLSFYAQYKMMEAKPSAGDKEKQNAYSAGVAYTTGDWQFKVGYAKNEELKVGGDKLKGSDDDVLSVQALYFVDPSAVLYARARTLDFGKAYNDRWKSADYDEYSVGVEYYF